jgi:hypothetical protein
VQFHINAGSLYLIDLPALRITTRLLTLIASRPLPRGLRQFRVAPMPVWLAKACESSIASIRLLTPV